jgi:coenzyme F420-reducing hydrogenase alpha subunit
VAHVLAALEAIEQALAVQPSSRDRQLRALLLSALFLQSHAGNLYFQVVPLALGLDNPVALAQREPTIYANAVTLRQLGSDLLRVVGGRATHPVTTEVGGFSCAVDAAELLTLAKRSDDALAAAMETVDLIHSLTPVAGSPLASHSSSPAADAAPAPATAAAPLPAALVRINNSWDELTHQAKLAAAKIGLRPVEGDARRAAEARAVELVEAVVLSAELCREIAAAAPAAVLTASQPQAGEGTGVVEAPSGTIRHRYSFDACGFVTAAEIVSSDVSACAFAPTSACDPGSS